jgi:septum formation protein
VNLILASASPRRAAILSGAGFSFKVSAASIDETRKRGESARVYVARLAREKARAVAALVRKGAGGRERRGGPRLRRGEQMLVIGADTAVVMGKEVWGKPRTKAEARRMLRRMSGRAHFVCTGVALIEAESGRERVFVEKTRVDFRKLTAKEIETYVATKEPYDKAGGYAIQGLASKFVKRIEGCYFNVMGLPLARFCEEMKKLGS